MSDALIVRLTEKFDALGHSGRRRSMARFGRSPSKRRLVKGARSEGNVHPSREGHRRQRREIVSGAERDSRKERREGAGVLDRAHASRDEPDGPNSPWIGAS